MQLGAVTVSRHDALQQRLPCCSPADSRTLRMGMRARGMSCWRSMSMALLRFSASAILRSLAVMRPRSLIS